MEGLEQKRMSYALKDKNVSKDKLDILSKLSSANERYADKLKEILADMGKAQSVLLNYEIEMKNAKETKAAEILLDVRTKITTAQNSLRQTINTLL